MIASETLRLLIIDDDDIDRQQIIRTLKLSQLACDITEASTAEEGLKLLSKEAYEAVLLDYSLTDKNAIDVLKTLRSDEYPSVAVIILSNYEDELIADQCLEAGAQDFLLKDELNTRRLRRAIRQARQRYKIEDELRTSREQLKELSEHDPLTGLLNRRGFEAELKRANSNLKRNHYHLAILLLDLDDFKLVNDTLGHDIGDTLLIVISERLQHIMRESDKLCRLGGDEFVILMVDFTCEQQAKLLAERIFNALQEPILLAEKPQIITASIGIAVFNEAVEHPMDLLKYADFSMYKAKQNGRNQSCFYTAGL